MVQDTPTNRIHKSNPLTARERTLLTKKISEYPTQEVAAEKIGVTLGALKRIILAGSGSHSNIEKIRTALHTS